MIFLELNPPSSPDLGELIEIVRELDSFDAFVVTELAMRRINDSWMDTLYTAIKLREATGKRLIPVLTSREVTIRGVTARTLMAINGGIEEMLIVRGDESPYGGAFGMSVSEILRRIRSIYEKHSKEVTLYVAANPMANLEDELRRAAEKLSAGADAIITQPTLDFDRLKSFINGLRSMGFKNSVIGSIMILDSLIAAERMEERCGVVFPNWFKKELSLGNWKKALIEAVRTLAGLCDGLHISPITGREFALELAEEGRRILNTCSSVAEAQSDPER